MSARFAPSDRGGGSGTEYCKLLSYVRFSGVFLSLQLRQATWAQIPMATKSYEPVAIFHLYERRLQFQMFRTGLCRTFGTILPDYSKNASAGVFYRTVSRQKS